MQVPAELRIKYLRRRMEDLERIRSCIEKDDYAYIQKVGHQVRGNAVTFDIPQIASIGLEMEKAAQKKDKERVRILIQKMESLVQTAQRPYLTLEIR